MLRIQRCLVVVGIISHKEKNSWKSKGLKFDQLNICTDRYGIGRCCLRARVLVSSEENRNVKHEGINPDSLLGKAASPTSVECEGSQTTYTTFLGINELTLTTGTHFAILLSAVSHRILNRSWKKVSTIRSRFLQEQSHVDPGKYYLMPNKYFSSEWYLDVVFCYGFLVETGCL